VGLLKIMQPKKPVKRGEDSIMAKKPYVDKEVCISCTLCVDMVPEVFRMDEDDLAEVYAPDGASEDKIQEAMDACPVSCIHWEE
jgi:ferredoxin